MYPIEYTTRSNDFRTLKTLRMLELYSPDTQSICHTARVSYCAIGIFMLTIGFIIMLFPSIFSRSQTLALPACGLGIIFIITASLMTRLMQILIYIQQKRHIKKEPVHLLHYFIYPDGIAIQLDYDFAEYTWNAFTEMGCCNHSTYIRRNDGQYIIIHNRDLSSLQLITMTSLLSKNIPSNGVLH